MTRSNSQSSLFRMGREKRKREKDEEKETGLRIYVESPSLKSIFCESFATKLKNYVKFSEAFELFRDILLLLGSRISIKSLKR